MRSRPQVLNPNPIQHAAAFTPPPSEAVTIKSLASNTLEYWKTVRVSWLSGYNIKWVIPGRGGAVTGSKSVWNLDVRVQELEEVIPARTAKYSLEPYVLVAGRPSIEPELGTRVTVKTTLPKPAVMTAPLLIEPPMDLGETARWLPTPESYVDGVWNPVEPPAGIDANLVWQASEANFPTLNTEFSYARLGQWETTTAMTLQDTNFLRLNGLQISKWRDSTLEPITLFIVAGVAPPAKYWGSLLRAIEEDGSTDLSVTNLDLRVMPDGNLHPFTWGWQRPLPLISENHTLSLFGFTLDSSASLVTLFTIDRTLQMADLSLPAPHSTTSKFYLGRTGDAMHAIDVLDVLFYRGPMSQDQIEQIANELDGAYGITARLSQEQG